MSNIANNPKARHDYFIDDTIECGIMLTGTEVKSIRAGKVNLKDSYAQIRNGELYIYAMHISPYEQGNINNPSPLRTRKLLIHKKEIEKLFGLTKEKGISLVPLSLYFVKNKVKIELAVARGKKLYDKRQAEAKKDAQRKIARHVDK